MFFSRCSLSVLCSVLSLFAYNAQAQLKEYQLKAAFLFNFAQFVEWPTNAFKDRGAPLIIGILGNDPFGIHLDEIVNGERVSGHPLGVRRIKRMEEISECHILFISQSESERLSNILEELKGRPVLTVEDFNGFAKRGGMIRFIMENNKVRLRIALEPIKAANLIVSSKLLRPAQIVDTGQD